ncbi:uncharacterized protein G2W53_038151 [Senna tora]|uniref:Uncharacterized protein n=1 Tax=Senna tora TaxID=362788 RepID=A0A834SKH4_9FABA|nr:uncharacterized protein G2W53_038151 [Senna tora]
MVHIRPAPVKIIRNRRRLIPGVEVFEEAQNG